MKIVKTTLILSAVLTLTACATTPEQAAERAIAQRHAEQNLQVALAAQCDKETAELLRQHFAMQEQTGVPDNNQKAFRLKYVDKISDPMFQACYKMAWQNYISQEQLREARYYYDDWNWRHSFYSPFWW